MINKGVLKIVMMTLGVGFILNQLKSRSPAIRSLIMGEVVDPAGDKSTIISK